MDFTGIKADMKFKKAMSHKGARNRATILGLFVASCLAVSGQAQKGEAYVDKQGVIRWGKTNEEVKAFGINYTAMFAHAYRSAKKLDIPIEQAIDDDIYHFARLGFDAFRVHVWDTQISDSAGNLLENEHLRLFDYALMKMKERGMKFIITPIAYWGDGWPERDTKTPGFSHKYGKDKCLTNPEAIKAQERYLYQFVNHANQYTGIQLKSDVDIIAFEISNEPHHNESAEKVTAFINRMVASMRKSGTKKPIFYNISHSIHLARAYFDSKIQGGTFQWYPTNLGAGHELEGNILLNVERYSIPFAQDPKFKKIAKIVYEFDAADVGRSYIYPAMARSFRTAGMQIATHFAYDPTFIADVNTEYGTHYMNLAYAPQKALSLMIAGEVFHRVPLYKDFGRYPGNATFDAFSISYEKDLAQMITETDFLYTNNTESSPTNAEKLNRIAGFGNSTIVRYAGKGAYFLDKLEEGVWRLEVMPDAIWKDDPFEKTSPKKKIAAINYESWPINIQLPNLGDGFSIKGINDGNSFSAKASAGSFEVEPGTYLLVKKGQSHAISSGHRFNNIIVKEFSAPPPSLEEVFVQHTSKSIIIEGVGHEIKADIYSPDSIHSVDLFASAPGRWMEKIAMKNDGGVTFRADIPASSAKQGLLKYHIVVTSKKGTYTYPSGLETHPWDWDFYDLNPYTVPIVAAESPIYLLDAREDADYVMRPWLKNSYLMPMSNGSAELSIQPEKLFVADPENRNAAPIYDYSVRYVFDEKIDGRRAELAEMSKLVLRARTVDSTQKNIQIALVTKKGEAFGGIVTLSPEPKDHAIDLKSLKRVKLVSLPRPYPTFLPYFVHEQIEGGSSLNMTDIEGLQLSIGPGMDEKEILKEHGIAIESVRLDR